MQQWIIVLLIAFLPTQLSKFFFMDFSFVSGVRIDYLAPVMYFTDILVGILIIWNYKVVLSLFKNKHFLVFLFFLGINIFFAKSQPLALFRAVKLIEFVFLFFIIKKAHISPKKILYAFTGSILFELGLALLNLTQKRSIQGIFYWFGERDFSLNSPGIAKASLNGVEILRPYATFSHPNSMGGFFLLVYFFLVLNPSLPKSIWKNIALMASAFLVFLSFSKVAIFTFLLLNLVLIFQKRKEINCLICTISKSVLYVIPVLIFASAQGDPLSGEKRITLMQNSFEIIFKNPLFGVGLGNYLLSQSAFPTKYAYHFLQPVHNIILLLLAEIGFVFCGWICFILFQWFKNNWRKEYVYICGVLILTGLFDHYWITLQQNFLLIPVIFGLLYNQKTKKV